MYISLTNTIGAIRTAIGIVRKNLQLWLDFNKSEVIGSEEVVNGDFSDGLTDWGYANASLNLEGVEINNIGLSNANTYVLQDNVGVLGNWYKLNYDVLETNGEILTLEQGSNINLETSTIGLGRVVYFKWDRADAKIIIKRVSAETKVTISNISVKEVTQFVKDKSPNTNNAKLFTGKALSFNGNDAVTDFGNPNVNLKSICFWVNLDTTTEQLFNLTATHSIEAVSGVVTLNGTWSNSNIYVDGIATTSIGTTPKRVVVTTDTNILVSDLEFARIGSDYGSLDLADVQIYDTEFTLADVLLDYNNPNHLIFDVGGSIALADLKAYWALSEGDGLVAYDSSGEGNNGTINGATYVPAQDTIPQLGMMDWAKGSNLYLSSEPTANESAAGDISYGSYSWGLNGFSNATIFGDNSVLRYRYGGSTTIGVEYTLSAFVIMDDNSEPDVTNLSSSGDFSLVVSGSVGVGVISKTNISGNIWRVSKVKTAVDSTTSNGIVKYTTQSAKGFKVVGWQLEESSSVGNYILTDGAEAIDVTTIQNPTNKGYDILGNALRLREHAFNLDGSGYAEVADNDSLDFGTGDFTVECWATYKFENTGSGLNVIISNGLASSASTLGFNLLTNSGDFVIRLGDGSNVYTKSIAGAPIESTWYYIAFTRVGTTLTVYLDDVDGVDYTDADIAVDVTTDNPITVGVDAQSTRKYKGLIDDTRLYNRALTQKEITQNYKQGINKHKATSSFSDDFSSDYGI